MATKKKPQLKPKDLVQSKAEDSAAEMIDTLVNIAHDFEAPVQARITAANSLLDRAFGKPNQEIKNVEETTLEELDLESLSDAELKDFKRLLAKANQKK